MKYFKNFFVSVLIVSVVLFFTQSAVVSAQARANTPFGGLRLFSLTCTCSANVLLFIMDYSSKSLKRLIYQPGASRLYMNFNIMGATYLLGTYTRGGQCEMYAGTSCTDINSDGMIDSNPGVGTS
jgi:hypothetical protein